MPTPSETAVLDRVGDEIEAVVLEARNALFLARITHNASRELVFRVHDPEHANAALQRLVRRARQEREWSFEMVGDVAWALAIPVLKLLGDARARIEELEAKIAG
ncbi:MAG: DUF695 domain-containing protein [Labilithrix sp.]|nr:DUF695 domain-containing protein [Labilithrix sp.]